MRAGWTSLKTAISSWLMDRLIKTRRLWIVPDREPVEGETRESRLRFSQKLGAFLPEAWPQEILSSGQEAELRRYLQSRSDWKLWGIWFALVKSENGYVVAGSCGYASRPDSEGSVEISYSILPPYEGQGFATEAVRSMINWAFAQNVQQVWAKVGSTNKASQRVLQKCGLASQAFLKDEESQLWSQSREALGRHSAD